MDPVSCARDLFVSFNTCMGSAEFKDKLARMVQYGSRGLAAYGKDSYSKETLAKIKGVQGTLGDARRAFRFFKELTILQGLPKDLSEKNTEYLALTLGNKLALFLYFLTDHVLWLKKAGVMSAVKGEVAERTKVVMKWFTLAHLINVVLCVRKLQDMQRARGTDQFSQAKWDQSMTSAVKSGLLVLQGIHVSGMFDTGDLTCGVAGVISSYMDVKAVWDEKRLAAAPKAK